MYILKGRGNTFFSQRRGVWGLFQWIYLLVFINFNFQEIACNPNSPSFPLLSSRSANDFVRGASLYETYVDTLFHYSITRSLKLGSMFNHLHYLAKWFSSHQKKPTHWMQYQTSPNLILSDDTRMRLRLVLFNTLFMMT